MKMIWKKLTALTVIMSMILSVMILPAEGAYSEGYESFTGNKLVLQGETVEVSGYPVDEHTSEITINGRTFTVFNQGSFRGQGVYGDFLGPHGGLDCTLTTVLRAYAPACASWTPMDTIRIAEKNAVNSDSFRKNYKKPLEKQLPITQLVADRILTKYKIRHQSVTNTTKAQAKKDIISTLKEGGVIFFTLSIYNQRTRRVVRGKYSMSFHTMAMIGCREDGRILVTNSAGRNSFVALDLDDVLDYMWFSKKSGSREYFGKEAGTVNYKYCIPSSAGYIKITEGARPCTYRMSGITPATQKSSGSENYTCSYCRGKKKVTIPKITSVKLAKTKDKKSGKNIRPEVIIRLNNGKLMDKEYYTVKYPAESSDAGTYKVTVVFKDHYKGKAALKYKVVA